GVIAAHWHGRQLEPHPDRHLRRYRARERQAEPPGSVHPHRAAAAWDLQTARTAECERLCARSCLRSQRLDGRVEKASLAEHLVQRDALRKVPPRVVAVDVLQHVEELALNRAEP